MIGARCCSIDSSAGLHHKLARSIIILSVQFVGRLPDGLERAGQLGKLDDTAISWQLYLSAPWSGRALALASRSIRLT